MSGLKPNISGFIEDEGSAYNPIIPQIDDENPSKPKGSEGVVVDRIFEYVDHGFISLEQFSDPESESAIPLTITATAPALPTIKPRTAEAYVIDRIAFSPSLVSNIEPFYNIDNILDLSDLQVNLSGLEVLDISPSPHGEIVQDRQPFIYFPELLILPTEPDVEPALEISLLDNVTISNNDDVLSNLIASEINAVLPEANPTSTDVFILNATQTTWLSTAGITTDNNLSETTIETELDFTLSLPNIIATENITSTLKNRAVLTSRLCGFPPFCSNSAFEQCRNTTLKECDECGTISAAFIGTFLCILGILIISGNLLVIWNVVRRKKGFSDKYNKIKGSLAVADLLAAVQIFAIAIPNFAWTLGLTSIELDYQQLQLRGSPSSYAGGIFNIFTIILSMFHLLFMGVQRLYAIRWPIKYKATKNDSPILGLSLVWGLALLFAAMPAFFNDFFTYTYYPVLFLYLPSFKSHDLGSKSFTEGIIITLFLYVFPYVVMTALLLTAWYYGQKYIKQSRSLSQHPSGRINKKGKYSNKKECALLRTLLLMQLAFTLTVLPQFICMVLFYTGVLTCDSFSLPYFIAFSFGMSSSFGNVLVYSLRDPNFRKSFKDVCVICCIKMFEKRVSNQEQAQVQEQSNTSNPSGHSNKSWFTYWSHHLRRKSTPNTEV